MAKTSQQQATPFSLPEVPVALREVPSQLREVPYLPLRAGRHITHWLYWQTSRISLLDDHSQRPPGKRLSKSA